MRKPPNHTLQPPPEERRCKAIKADGERCWAWSVKVSTRQFCMSHEGLQKPKPGRVTPLQKKKRMFQQLTEEGQAVITELLEDPDLLNPKTSVAANHYLMLQLPLDPPEELVRSMAMNELRRRLSGVEGLTVADLEPSEADMEVARMRLRVTAAKEIREHGKLQIQALKQKADAELLLQGAMPVLEEYNDQIARLMAKYLPAEKRIAFAADLRSHLEAAIGRLKRLKGG